MGQVVKEKFGSHMTTPEGYFAVVKRGDYKHQFGGTGWDIVDSTGNSSIKPSLLLLLDLNDPKLRRFKFQDLIVFPVCSHINSDAWYDKQVYVINAAEQKVEFLTRISDDIEPLDPEDSFPDPLPEKDLSLEPLPEKAICSDEQSYWTACDEFLGGESFIRVSGTPVWLEDVEEETCDCGRQMLYFCSIGYEKYENATLLDDAPFFIGEGALYFFFCEDCLKVHVISQSA